MKITVCFLNTLIDTSSYFPYSCRTLIDLGKFSFQALYICKIVINNNYGLSFIDEEDIIIIQRENRSTVIYTSDGHRFVTSESLNDLDARLDNNLFLRSHKSYIINISMIYKIYPYGRWTYIAKLRNTDLDALVTQEKYEEIKRRFK